MRIGSQHRDHTLHVSLPQSWEEIGSDVRFSLVHRSAAPRASTTATFIIEGKNQRVRKDCSTISLFSNNTVWVVVVTIEPITYTYQAWWYSKNRVHDMIS